MDSFLSKLSANVERTILSSLSDKLDDFAGLISNMPESKVSKEDIIKIWNAKSEFKISPSATNESKSAVETLVSPKIRSQTDKTRKCQVLKLRGDDKGNPCSKNCVVNSEFCPEHLKKNQLKK